MSSGHSLSPEQHRQQQHQQQQQDEMVEVKADSEEHEAPRPSSSSSRHAHGASGSRPPSSHRLDTGGLAAALPHSSSHPSAGMRSRITVVCAECKRLKLKCDRRTPCSSCVKRDTVNRCHYSAAAADKIDLQSVHNRVLSLEQKLAKIASEGIKIGGLADPRPTSLVAVNNGSSVVVSLDDVNSVWLQELDVHLDVELKVLEPDVPAELGWAQVFPSPEVFFPSPDAAAAYGNSLDPNMPTVTPQLLQKLPDGPLRDAIMAQFQHTLAMHPCTNWNDFKQRSQAMFSGLGMIDVHSAVFPAPPSPPTAPTSLTFFASVAAAFALGAQSLAEMKRWGTAQVPFDSSLPNPQGLYVKAEEYFSLSQSTLQVAQRTAAYDLDFLMTMRMQCLYLLHDGKPRVAHSVLPEVGKMINIARSMGLHIDPDEHPGKYSIFEMEMRRRVWWDIYYLDVFISDCMALPPLIDDATFNCKMPSDCDDLQLHSPTSMLPAPTEHSDYMYFILKSGLAQLVKKIGRRPIRNDQNEPDINIAMELEQGVKDWLNALPPQFQLPADEAGASVGPPFLVAQRCELACIANQIFIKIYHSFLRRDRGGERTDEKSTAAQAIITSINAAHQLVHASKIMHTVLRHTRPATYMFYSFGRALFHAAVICAYAVIADPGAIWRDTALRDLETSLSIMRDPMLATGRGPARGGAEGERSEALRVVEMLRAKCDQTPRNLLLTGGKRRHGDVDLHLQADFQMPYVGGAVATAPEEYDQPPPQVYGPQVHYQQALPVPHNAVVHTLPPTPGPSVEQQPPPHVVRPPQPQQRIRVPTHPPPPPEAETPYIPVVPQQEWTYQKPSTGGKDRSKGRPSIGVRRRDGEAGSGGSSRRLDTSTPSSGSSGHSPVNMRKSSNFASVPPPTSGVTMPGAAQFQQAQQAQQEFAQQYAPPPPQPEMTYYQGGGMYGPPTQQQHQQQLYYAPAQEDQQQQQHDPSFQGAVNPQLISPEAHRAMPMHMPQQARNSMAPSIPSTPVDAARYNAMLPTSAVPGKQDGEEADQTMLAMADPSAMNGTFEVPLPAMGWEAPGREAYQQAEHWQGYNF